MERTLYYQCSVYYCVCVWECESVEVEVYCPVKLSNQTYWPPNFCLMEEIKGP